MTDRCQQHPAKFGAHLSDSAEPHRGEFVWKNQAELVWECADDCPHPSHERMDPE